MCFKGCTFGKFPGGGGGGGGGGACPQTPLDCVRAHTPMNDIVWPDQTKFACSGPACYDSQPTHKKTTHAFVP